MKVVIISKEFLDSELKNEAADLADLVKHTSKGLETEILGVKNRGEFIGGGITQVLADQITRSGKHQVRMRIACLVMAKTSSYALVGSKTLSLRQLRMNS